MYVLCVRMSSCGLNLHELYFIVSEISNHRIKMETSTSPFTEFVLQAPTLFSQVTWLLLLQAIGECVCVCDLLLLLLFCFSTYSLMYLSCGNSSNNRSPPQGRAFYLC